MCSAPKMPSYDPPEYEAPVVEMPKIEPLPDPEPLPTPQAPPLAPVSAPTPPQTYNAPPPMPPPAPVQAQTPPPVLTDTDEDNAAVKKRKSKRKEIQQASRGTDALRIPLDKSASIGSSGAGTSGSTGLNIPKK